MLGAQVRLDNGRAPAHPLLVSTSRFMNVHRHDLALGEETLVMRIGPDGEAVLR
jgi:hypothetical protein